MPVFLPCPASAEATLALHHSSPQRTPRPSTQPMGPWVRSCVNSYPLRMTNSMAPDVISAEHPFYVFLANRGNPTGSSQTGDALGKALASVSYNTTFNLDFSLFYHSFISLMSVFPLHTSILVLCLILVQEMMFTLNMRNMVIPVYMILTVSKFLIIFVQLCLWFHLLSHHVLYQQKNVVSFGLLEVAYSGFWNGHDMGFICTTHNRHTLKAWS